jgi:hypothetical protein
VSYPKFWHGAESDEGTGIEVDTGGGLAVTLFSPSQWAGLTRPFRNSFDYDLCKDWIGGSSPLMESPDFLQK